MVDNVKNISNQSALLFSDSIILYFIKNPPIINPIKGIIDNILYFILLNIFNTLVIFFIVNLNTRPLLG